MLDSIDTAEEFAEFKEFLSTLKPMGSEKAQEKLRHLLDSEVIDLCLN